MTETTQRHSTQHHAEDFFLSNSLQPKSYLAPSLALEYLDEITILSNVDICHNNSFFAVASRSNPTGHEGAAALSRNQRLRLPEGKRSAVQHLVFVRPNARFAEPKTDIVVTSIIATVYSSPLSLMSKSSSSSPLIPAEVLRLLVPPPLDPLGELACTIPNVRRFDVASLLENLYGTRRYVREGVCASANEHLGCNEHSCVCNPKHWYRVYRSD